MSIQLGDALAAELNISGTITPAASFSDVPAITTSVPGLTAEMNAQAQALANRDAYLAQKLRFCVTPEQFGAIGDGTSHPLSERYASLGAAQAVYPFVTSLTQEIDWAAYQAAMNSGQPIYGRDDAVYIFADTALQNGGEYIASGRATIKLRDGVVLNNNAVRTNFTPLLRLQGMDFVNLGYTVFDHNRDGQTFPTTGTNFGRGSNPYRHNGSVEISPDATGTTPSRNVFADKATFINSILNGLVLWQVDGAIVAENSFANSVWNGVAGAGLRDVTFINNQGYRNGVATVWPTARNDGDRALIQIREFPIGFTTASEGIPCITTGEYANGGINKNVRFIGNHGEECNVETIFGRAITGLVSYGNTSLNVGYGRTAADASFIPAHIWYEFVEGYINDNEVWQTTVRAGEQVPDGIVAISMTGDASATFPLVGDYLLDARGNRVYSAKTSGGIAQSGLINRGVRASRNVDCDYTTVDGCDSDAIQFTNTSSFETSPTNVKNVSANNSRLINSNLTGGDGPVGFVRFGASTAGDLENISALNCTVDATQANVIVFNSNLSAFNRVNVQHSKGIGSQQADGDLVQWSKDGSVLRRVKNTFIGTSNVAGFQAEANGGNTVTTGSTSSTYSGSFGVPLCAFVHASGSNTGGLFLTAFAGPVVMRPNGARSFTSFTSGRSRFGSTTADDGVNLLQVDGLLGLKSYAVAALPTGVSNSSVAFASNGRKVGEGAGAGTGVPVYYSNSQWRVFSTDAQVQA